MNQLFLEVLNMSLTGCYVILFVLVVRFLLRKAPKIFSYAMWFVVLFRLVCPFSFQSIFSLIPAETQKISQRMILSQAPEINRGIEIIGPGAGPAMPSPAFEAGVSAASHIPSWIAIGAMVWLAGVLILLAYSVYTTMRLKCKLKDAISISADIYQVGTIETPFVFGIIRPKVYLPVGLNAQEKNYIMLHEKTHINRRDHIAKPLFFLVLCLHWFNPLVWVAFYFMSQDMELSCDESVIRKMGRDLRGDYAGTLLALSASRPKIVGYPLAFGENDVKGRIVNILNYKKPGFWAVLVAVVGVGALSIGLMSNPHEKQLTVEDYANQYIQKDIENYKNVKIIESEITRLEKIGYVEDFHSFNIELWQLEYRLKPEDMSKVGLAGGLGERDGWIVDEGITGRPVLVFSYKGPEGGSKLEYMGHLSSAENDLSTLAGQETALQIFLESIGRITRETYAGNHVVVKFPLSTGETSQLLLSQPVLQGDGGIWAVERWMDGNGSIYYHTPDIPDSPSDPMLSDPMAVALDFIRSGLGQWQVTMEDLIPQFDATLADFMETPESQYIGFISNFKVEEVNAPYFHLDQIEWLTLEDEERLKALKINPEDLPNGFYIHNPNNYPMYHQVTEGTEYNIIKLGGGVEHQSVSMTEFVKHLEAFSDFAPPFWVTTKDGYVQSITEQYIP